MNKNGTIKLSIEFRIEVKNPLKTMRYNLNHKWHALYTTNHKGFIRGKLHNHQNYLFKTTARVITRL